MEKSHDTMPGILAGCGVDCPTCGARAGYVCRQPTAYRPGQLYKYNHPSRIRAEES